MKKGDKIYILGNGSQAPYGIGEIIDILPAYHNRKIVSVCGGYYVRPTLRLNGKHGNLVDIDPDDGSLINIGRTYY